jgi:hypothetical protein
LKLNYGPGQMLSPIKLSVIMLLDPSVVVSNPVPLILAPVVCTENLIRVDWAKESSNDVGP